MVECGHMVYVGVDWSLSSWIPLQWWDFDIIPIMEREHDTVICLYFMTECENKIQRFIDFSESTQQKCCQLQYFFQI